MTHRSVAADRAAWDEFGNEYVLKWGSGGSDDAAKELKRGAVCGRVVSWGLDGMIEWSASMPTFVSRTSAKSWLEQVFGEGVLYSYWEQIGGDLSLVLCWRDC